MATNAAWLNAAAPPDREAFKQVRRDIFSEFFHGFGVRQHKGPLEDLHTPKGARFPLDRGRARILRFRPFTIPLAERMVLAPRPLKLGPGRRTTSISLLREMY